MLFFKFCTSSKVSCREIHLKLAERSPSQWETTPNEYSRLAHILQIVFSFDQTIDSKGRLRFETETDQFNKFSALATSQRAATEACLIKVYEPSTMYSDKAQLGDNEKKIVFHPLESFWWFSALRFIIGFVYLRSTTSFAVAAAVYIPTCVTWINFGLFTHR